MSRLRGKCARLIALLALLAGLVGTAMPGLAAPAEPKPMMPASMDCDHGGQHRQAPQPHLPAGDCCMVNACAMTLALPVPLSGLLAPAFPNTQDYAVRTPLQPAGIVTAPLPHPPKSTA
ncbi:hypothetical protein [Dongia sedimenti]|uniref:DUF2946 family protein n=1 Tax=Dongia sedimenti TaxID=3064282 RepID=A0ABU0YRW6_9PROT|nr:hypothetical protein [Rhodospirillaceae bacterium R-7]